MNRISNRGVVGALIAVAVTACSNDEQAKRAFLANGNSLMEQRKFQEAILEYRNAIKADGFYGEAHFQLAEAYASSGNSRAAYREYVRAADLLPQDTRAQIKAATFLLLGKQYEDARTRIQRVVDRDPSNVEAQLLLGKALAGLDDFEGALKQMEEAIEIAPGRAQLYSGLAILKQKQGDVALAKAAFEKAVEVEPRSLQAWLDLASFRWSSNDLPGAELALKKATEIDPKSVLANRALAVFYTSSRRAPQAEPYLKAVVAVSNSAAAQLQLADYYMALKRRDEAVAILKRLAADRLGSTGAEVRLAAIAYQSGDKRGGHSQLDAVLKREPRNVQALLLDVQWLGAEGKLNEAAARAAEAVTADPTSVPALFTLGALQASLQQNTQAMASFSEALKLNPKLTEAQVYLSQLNLTSGSPDAAMEFAQSAATNSPDNPVVKATLVRNLIAQKNLPAAEKELAGLRKAYPTVAGVHTLDASLRLQKNDVSGARASFEKALTLNPDNTEALAGLTMLDLSQKRTSEAGARVRSGLARHPDRPDLLRLAAQVHVAAQEFSTAEQSLRRAIQVAPDDAVAYNMLAGLYLRTGRRDEALAEFDGIAAREPKNIGVRTMAAMLVDGQNKRPEAKKRYQEILDIDPAAGLAANNLAWLWANDGENLDQALRLAQSASIRFPDSPEIQDTIGWIYFKKELPSLAIVAFQASADKEPGNPLFRLHLAQALAKSGEVGKARQAAQEAIRLKPDYAEARSFLATLQG